jgi:DNA-binding MarR family transcriptional regulator
MDDAAAAFCELFPAVYLHLCRRHPRTESKKTRLTPQQDAALQHLALSGPLTIGELARHFARAQSVVSEIVGGLEDKGLLERMRDAHDRRRTLVWLTDEARRVLAARAEVLDRTRVARAMRALPPSQREALIVAMRALVRASKERSAPFSGERAEPGLRSAPFSGERAEPSPTERRKP